MALPPLCLLHIGKTGGTYLRTVLRHNRSHWSRPIQVLRHRATLASTAESYGDTRQIAFTFRNPSARFVSAFYSRQRQGRPTFQHGWSAEEAATFLWFETAEELALALTSSQPRRQSAALFAMSAITHLRRNTAFYLHGRQQLRLNRGQIIMCVDTVELDARLPAVMARLGVSEFTIPSDPKRHASPVPLPPLSQAAEDALRQHWAGEYQLYDTCRQIAGQLGLSG